MIFLDYALTGLQYISISVTLTAILSWCDIYFAMKNILRDLGVWCGVFNAMPKNTRICQKNLLRLLGVEVRSHTLAIQKNLLPVVCNQIFFINDTGLGVTLLIHFVEHGPAIRWMVGDEAAKKWAKGIPYFIL